MGVRLDTAHERRKPGGHHQDANRGDRSLPPAAIALGPPSDPVLLLVYGWPTPERLGWADLGGLPGLIDPTIYPAAVTASPITIAEALATPQMSPRKARPKPRKTPVGKVRAAYPRSLASPAPRPTQRVIAAFERPSAKHRRTK